MTRIGCMRRTRRTDDDVARLEIREIASVADAAGVNSVAGAVGVTGVVVVADVKRISKIHEILFFSVVCDGNRCLDISLE